MIRSLPEVVLLFGMTLNSIAHTPGGIEGTVSTTTTNGGLPFATYSRLDFQKSRIIHDMDGDGWCELWCSLFQVDPVNLTLTADTDQDGMTDYAEMVLMQSPSHPNPFPSDDSSSGQQSSSTSQPGWVLQAELIQEGLQNNLQAKEASQIRRQTPSDVLSQSQDFSLTLSQSSYRDQSAGNVFDSNSAKVTKAYTLWPGGSASFEDATGASLPAPAPELPLIGIWDEGFVDPQTPGLTGRVIVGPDLVGSFFEAAHAKNTASIIALADQGDGNQGLAWEGKIKIFSDQNDYREMANEAVHNPSNGKVGMTFSNHSYSPGAGWQYDGAGHKWWGPITAGPNDEDPEFGSYTLQSRLIDSVTYHAQTPSGLFCFKQREHRSSLGLGRPQLQLYGSADRA